MKTIGYVDRCDGGRVLHLYLPSMGIKKKDRITQAFINLRDMGNVILYYVNGRKCRRIGKRGM